MPEAPLQETEALAARLEEEPNHRNPRSEEPGAAGASERSPAHSLVQHEGPRALDSPVLGKESQ